MVDSVGFPASAAAALKIKPLDGFGFDVFNKIITTLWGHLVHFSVAQERQNDPSYKEPRSPKASWEKCCDFTEWEATLQLVEAAAKLQRLYVLDSHV